MTPTALSLRHLRNEGWTCDEVERHVPHARTSRDYLGIIDIIAIRGAATLAVQTTTASNVAARAHKIRESPHLEALRAAGWSVVAHGWRDDGSLREVTL